MPNPVYTLAASNLSKKQRSSLDYYGTNSETIKALLDAEQFDRDIWEPASGHGNIVNVLREYNYNVWSTDIHDYGCQENIIDFLDWHDGWHGSIITNPPYCVAEEFVNKALSQIDRGHKVAMLLRLQFLEGQKRYERLLKDNPPARVYIFVDRQVCSKDDTFTEGSALCYIWAVWEKGNTNPPIIKWLQTN